MQLPPWPSAAEKMPEGREWKLERMLQALELIGNPHLRLPPVIHIAGSNGKGSTQAFLKALLEGAGHLVHSYTSPHLIKYNERIYLAGQNISDEDLLDVLERTRIATTSLELSFFEATTAAAFMAFAETPAEYLILETGLGGRLDATNVVPYPAACIITPISLEHTQYLGDTILKITAEKAGIMKPGCPVIIARQLPEVMDYLWNYALKIGVTPHIADLYQGEITSLYGPHQKINAGAAMKCLDILGIGYDLNDLDKAFIPARLQHITSGKLYDLLPVGSELIIDGSHNPAGASVTRDYLQSLSNFPTYFIIGMMADKDVAEFIKFFADQNIISVPVPNARICADPRLISSNAAENLEKAFAKLPESPCRVIITGSLYLAGIAIAQNKF